MNLSSILIITPTECMQSTVSTLNALTGVEVHVSEEHSGRIIATQEAESISAEVAGLQRIKTLPDILYAEMVFHYFEDDAEIPVELSDDSKDIQGTGQTESACYKS